VAAGPEPRIIVFGSAILLELAQLLTPDRHARVVDALRKLIGGVLGIAFARLIISLCHVFQHCDFISRPAAEGRIGHC
jgi:hypothetical protein